MEKAQHAALSKSEEVWLCCEQLDRLMKQLGLAAVKDTNIDAASAKAAEGSKRELICMQKDLYLSQQRSDAADSSPASFHKGLDVTAIKSKLEFANVSCGRS